VSPAALPAALPTREIALVDLLDRLLAGGIVLSGDITLAIADIDMVRISLRALITSINRTARSGAFELNA
jgi:hypothetical protein